MVAKSQVNNRWTLFLCRVYFVTKSLTKPKLCIDEPRIWAQPITCFIFISQIILEKIEKKKWNFYRENWLLWKFFIKLLLAVSFFILKEIVLCGLKNLLLLILIHFNYWCIGERRRIEFMLLRKNKKAKCLCTT